MSTSLLNFEEADVYTRAIDDPITRELTRLAFSGMVKKWLKGERPNGDFDMLFFVDAIREAFTSHKLIEGLLRGESLLWPETIASDRPDAKGLEAANQPLTEAERDELERRRHSLRSDPANVVTWEEVKSRALARFQK